MTNMTKQENENLFIFLVQAAAWQGETLRGQYSFKTKQKFNAFQNQAYKIIDEINNLIKDDEDVLKIFDEQTSFILDVVRMVSSIDNEYQKSTLLEIIEKLKQGELKISRSKKEEIS